MSVTRNPIFFFSTLRSEWMGFKQGRKKKKLLGLFCKLSKYKLSLRKTSDSSKQASLV